MVLSVDTLAWALFVTDHDVEAFVSRVSDDGLLLRDESGRVVGKRWTAGDCDRRRDRAFEVAWKRDERRGRTRAYLRAESILRLRWRLPPVLGPKV